MPLQPISLGDRGGHATGISAHSLPVGAARSLTVLMMLVKPSLQQWHHLDEVTGQVFKTATLTGRQSGKNASGFLKITLQSVVVSAFGTSSADSDQLPLDHLTLSYGALEYAFMPQKADGSAATPITAGWNTVTNQASSAAS